MTEDERRKRNGRLPSLVIEDENEDEEEDEWSAWSWPYRASSTGAVSLCILTAMFPIPDLD